MILLKPEFTLSITAEKTKLLQELLAALSTKQPDSRLWGFTSIKQFSLGTSGLKINLCILDSLPTNLAIVASSLKEWQMYYRKLLHGSASPLPPVYVIVLS